MALLWVVGVDSELAEPSDPIHDRVPMDAEAISGVADAPAVEQCLERRDELEPPGGRAPSERSEHRSTNVRIASRSSASAAKTPTSASVWTERSG